MRTNDYLLITDVPDMVSIFDKVYSLQYSESFTGSLFMTSNIGPYISLRNSLLEVFSNSQRNYNCCLLTNGINTLYFNECTLSNIETMSGTSLNSK